MGTLQRRTRQSVRLHVRFSTDDVESLRAHALELGLPLTATVRTLARIALAGQRDQRLEELEAVTVAALMAAEQCLRLVEQLLPGGAKRSAEMAGSVRLAALERVAQIRAELEESDA